ncbi:uncharacterized protein LOC142340578 isoform X2 [Convolutriloba macropyga]|uniref:uncharacterized protein LOC142340578 isoform X2 n=1 Tax=Convolutriloba macropyga TaxID=536237 RepID=UPI003F51E188
MIEHICFHRQRSSHSESDSDKKDDDLLENPHINHHHNFESASPLRRSYHPSTEQSSYFGNASNVARNRQPPGSILSTVPANQTPNKPAPTYQNYSQQNYADFEHDDDDQDDSNDYLSFNPSFYPSGQQPISPNSSFRARKTNQHSKHGEGQPYNYGIPSISHNTSTSPSPTRKVAKAAGRSSDKIRVCVRKRPMLKREKRDDVDIVRVNDSTVLVNEEKVAVDMTKYSHKHEYLFDEAFSERDDNKTVFERAVKPLIEHVINGGKSTCFAYGQTGSGKTHTIMGSGNISHNPGLYLLAADQIFRTLRSGQIVYVAFFEIYCGQLYDLLNGRAKLHAREDAKQRVNISNLRETRVNSMDDLLAVVAIGGKHRSVGQSGVNPDSSRSHAVLQIQLKSLQSEKSRRSSNNDSRSGQGRMSFIDLAGSERAAEAGDQNKQTRQEGAEINTSLLALKECIRALDQDSKHTPFRQSKLTQVLKESFIGDSKTCMIANISPTVSACDNTLNTLRYADRVKQLKAQCFSTNSPSSAQAVNVTSTASSNPKFTRKVKSLVATAVQSPNKSAKEPNRAAKKKRFIAGSSSGLKRSNSDISTMTTTMTTFNALTIDDISDNTDFQRSKSVESFDELTLYEETTIPVPRSQNVVPEPQQNTVRIDSPVSVSSGSVSPISEIPSSAKVGSFFQKRAGNDVKPGDFTAADNEVFASNYLHHYGPAKDPTTVSTRKSISSPDLRRESESQLSIPEGSAQLQTETPVSSPQKQTQSKNNPVAFFRSMKSPKSNNLDQAERRSVARNSKLGTADQTRSPKSQRKIVKFFGIESSSYSEIDPSGEDPVATQRQNADSRIAVPDRNITGSSENSKTPKSSASKRFSSSADDIRQAAAKTPTSSSTGKMSNIGKLSFADTRRRRSPSVSEDETPSPHTSNINISRAIPDPNVDTQQPSAPQPPNSKPSRPNVRTTPRDRATSFSAAKKMNLADFSKQPPPKMGRAVGSFENLVQQNQQGGSGSHPVTPESTQESLTSQKRPRSRHSSSGEDATSVIGESPRVGTGSGGSSSPQATVNSASSTANNSPEQTLASNVSPLQSAKLVDSSNQTTTATEAPTTTSQSFVRSQSMRTNRSNGQSALSTTSNQRSRSQSPGSKNRKDSKSSAGSGTSTPSSNIIHKAQTTLISAHKEHLTQVSKCCTKELNCLREMELGNKAFKDYVKQVESYLARKQKAIAQMQAHLAEYTKLCEQATQNTNTNTNS